MKIEAPKGCPSCSALLYQVNDQLFCPNNIDCPAQTSKRVQAFTKSLKIKGFGEAAIEKLELTDPSQLLDLKVADYLQAGFSEHMAAKLQGVIEDRINQGITPSEFIAAMSIPLIGDTAARKLQVPSIDGITTEVCKSSGLGDKATTNLMQWVIQSWPLYKDGWGSKLKQPTVTTIKSQSTGVTVCITGKLNDYTSRDAAALYLQSLGVTVKDSVTKAVNYLICEDGKTTSSSYKKASETNIPIITIKNLEEIINVNKN